MIEKKLNKICKNYGILAAYIFGSLEKEGADLLKDKKPEKVDPLADIDVGVVFLKKPLDAKERIKTYGRLYMELSEILSPLSLDLVFLHKTGVVIQYEAINGILVYSCDDDLRLDYEEGVIKFYQDWKPDYGRYVNEVLEAISR